MILAPSIIDPFGGNDFTTNLSSVVITGKLSLNTYKLFLNGAEITNKVTYIVSSDNRTEIPVPFFPLLHDTYFYIQVSLIPNSINILDFVVEDNTSVGLGGPLRASKLINIACIPTESTGVVLNPVTKLYSDIKNKSVILKFVDTNDIFNSPIGSGYNIYYSKNVEDRDSSYVLLNSDPLSKFDNIDVSYDVSGSSVIEEEILRKVPEEIVGSESSYEESSPKEYGIRYFIETKNNVWIPTYSVESISLQGTDILYITDPSICVIGNTLVLDKGLPTQEQVSIQDTISGSYVVLSNPLLFDHNIGSSIELYGASLNTLMDNQYRDQLQIELSSHNVSLETFESFIAIGNNIYDSNIIESLLNDLQSYLNNPIKLSNFISSGSNTLYTLNTSGLTVPGSSLTVNKGEPNEETLVVLTAVPNVSITFTTNFNYDHNINEVIINASEVKKIIRDSERLFYKYPNYRYIYNYRLTSTTTTEESILELIYRCSSIASLYPSLAPLYVYNVFISMPSFERLYKIYSEVDNSFNISFHVLTRLYIDPLLLSNYSGLYKIENYVTKIEDYTKYFYIKDIVRKEISSMSATPLTTLSVKLDSTFFPENIFNSDEAIFFKISFVYVNQLKRIFLESPLSIEHYTFPTDISGTFVEASFPTSASIQSSLISSILEDLPNIDIKPGSVARSLFVNPFSSAIYNLYYREYFREVSQSFVSLLYFDGSDTTGISTPVNNSLNKKALRSALNLEDTDLNNAAIQDYIDNKFDLLAENYGISRGVSTPSTGKIIVSISNLPSTDSIVLAAGTLVSTTSPVVYFETLKSLYKSDFSPYKNGSGYYTASVSIRSTSTGSATVVPANSIVNVTTLSSTFVKVNNPADTFGGKDYLNNLELYEKVKSARVSADTGTEAGILNTIVNSGLVDKAMVVSSDNPYCKRAFDYTRQEQSIGAVDVYVKGINPAVTSDRIGVFYDRLSGVSIDYTISRSGDLYNLGSLFSEINISDLIDKVDNYIDIYSIESGYFYGTPSQRYRVPSKLNFDTVVKENNFSFSLNLFTPELSIKSVLSIEPTGTYSGRILFKNTTLDLSKYIGKYCKLSGFDNIPNNSVLSYVTGAGIGYIDISNRLNNVFILESPSGTPSVDLSGNLDLFGQSFLFNSIKNPVEVQVNGTIIKYIFDDGVNYLSYLGKLIYLDFVSSGVKNVYGKKIISAGINYIEIDRFTSEIISEVISDPLISAVFSENSVSCDVSITCVLRKNFKHGWSNRPFIDVVSVTDVSNISYKRDLNYYLYNNSPFLLEGGSISEDSGIILEYSPLEGIISNSFTSGTSLMDRVIKIENSFFTSQIILSTIDGSHLYYPEEDFSIIKSGRYFYIRLNSSFTYNDLGILNLKVLYGPSRSLSKIVSFRVNHDSVIDSVIYSYFPRVEYEGSGILKEGVHYKILRGNKNAVYFCLLNFGFDTDSGAVINIDFFKTISIGAPDYINIPEDSRRDYSIELLSGKPYTLSRLGIDYRSIVVYPYSVTGTRTDPYKVGIDYKILIEPDSYVSIQRIDSGSIKDSSKINIEYRYADEVNISYSYDSQVNLVTNILKNKIHLSSDLMVKRLLPTYVDIKAIVYLKPSADKDRVDISIRKAVFDYVNKMDVGESLYESDVLALIDNVSGVRNVKDKLTTLTLADGEVSYLEKIDKSYFTLYNESNVSVYYTPPQYVNEFGDVVSVLKYTPLPNGGFPEKERFVYVNGVFYTLVTTPEQVGQYKGLAHISSSGSIFVSFFDWSLEKVDVEVTYQVNATSISQNIEILPFQYIEINRLDISYYQESL